MRIRVAWLWAGVLLAGCGASERNGPIAANGSSTSATGSASILMQDHLPWPYRLQRVAVALDGELQYSKTGEVPRQIWVAVFDKLPAGEHTIQVQATALYSSGTIGDECSISLRGHHTFKLGAAPAQVILDVHAGGVTQDFVRRVHLDIRATGVEDLGDVASSGGAFQPRIRANSLAEEVAAAAACKGKQGIDAAICNALARVDMARRARDVVKVLCYNDKLVQMLVLRKVIDDRRREELKAQSSGDQAAAEHERWVLETATRRIDLLLQELRGCTCEYPAFFDEPIERFGGHPACRGKDEVGPVGPFTEPSRGL